MCLCTLKQRGILKEKNALLKSVPCVMEDNLFVSCEVRTNHFVPVQCVDIHTSYTRNADKRNLQAI
jgi:hypothetical protein